MTIKDDPDLEDALDGLQNAVIYCESIDEGMIAEGLARWYSMVARASKDEHWDSIEDPDEWLEELMDDVD